MPFYEVIFETGEYSIMQADSDEEVLKGVKEQHRRAISGEAGGPGGWPATRVSRVLKYDEHPGEFIASGLVPLKDALKAVEGVAMGDQISVWEAAAAIRDLSNPLKAESEAHESNYKAPEASELEAKLWQ
jgi:hypothetical protein